MVPFRLAVEPLMNAAYALTVSQYPYPARKNGRELPPIEMVTIAGLALASAQDLVLEVLRANHYKPATLQRERKKPFDLCEESGVRLSLLFKAIAPLANLDHIREIQQKIWAMSDEEAYYWFSKCSGPDGCRGVRALRILYGAHLPLECEEQAHEHDA